MIYHNMMNESFGNIFNFYADANISGQVPLVYTPRDPGHIPTPPQAYLDAGIDLYTHESITLRQGDNILVETHMAQILMPANYFGMVCSRSGLAASYGIAVTNAPGIIDIGYSGQICAIMSRVSSHGGEVISLSANTRIAQLVLVGPNGPARNVMAVSQENIQWLREEIFTTGDNSRGAAGFGSTGLR